MIKVSHATIYLQINSEDKNKKSFHLKCLSEFKIVKLPQI